MTACQQALWMKQDLIDYDVRLDDVPIMCDNKGVDLSKNPVQHSRTKHIEIRHHFLRDNVQKGHISIEKVPSVDNIADILTKPLKRESKNLSNVLGLGMMEHIPKIVLVRFSFFCLNSSPCSIPCHDNLNTSSESESPEGDRGTRRGRHSTSSSSAFDQPSSSHLNDDDDDGNHEGTSRVQSKEHCDSLIAQINGKSVENSDLNAQLQEKVFAITALKNELRKLKGKNVVNIVVSKPNATLALGMFKLDIEPIYPRLKNNMNAHEKMLVYASQTCPNSPKPSEKLVDVTPINKNKRVRFAKPVTSSNNIPKQTDSLKTKNSNKPLLTSTGVKPTPSARGSKPSGNTKNNKIHDHHVAIRRIK
ncbi:hypothetical protein Tco_0712610 [Tanacetum coccineum]